MALSLTHWGNPRPQKSEAIRSNNSAIAFSRVFTHSEEQAREYVSLAVQLIERLAESMFPVRLVVFAVWKGNVHSGIPGDAGYFIPLMRAEMKRRKFPILVELSEVETLDPYGSLLNLGATYVAHRNADYLLSVSLQAIDYLSSDVADGFIEATLAGSFGVGLAMSEVSDCVGPNNRLSWWHAGMLSMVRGFATSAEVVGTDLCAGAASAQEQTVTLVNLRRHCGRACVSMIEPAKQGLYQVPTSPAGKELHGIVAASIQSQQTAWLKTVHASADELQSVIRH